MAQIEVVSERKKALLEYKETLLNDISCCESKIHNLLSSCRQECVQDSDSSDSETDLLELSVQRSHLTSTELRTKWDELRTCLHATQELTSLQILETEVNVLVDAPKLTEKYKDMELEEGIWREIMSECRVDLVPFSISFYVHQPTRKFGAPTYHNLRVNVGKPAHEKELSKSVLSEVTRPSDVVQIMRNYAQEHRSRRSTLAKLTEKYSDGQMHMGLLPDGGYMLRCLEVLELSWQLENKWSPIAPFCHRMKFDIEYMDEQYIKAIRHHHRQLQDPAIETDERTYLLSKIIDTCISAYEHNKTHESDSDHSSAQRLDQRHTTLDHGQVGIQEAMTNRKRKKDKDSEVMAPPKTLPKKAKNKAGNINEDVNSNAKRNPKNLVVAAKNKTVVDKNGDTNQIKVNSQSVNKNEVVREKETHKTNVQKVADKVNKEINKTDKQQKVKVNDKLVSKSNMDIVKVKTSKTNVVNKENNINKVDKANTETTTAKNKEGDSVLKTKIPFKKLSPQNKINGGNVNDKAIKKSTKDNVTNKQKTVETTNEQNKKPNTEKPTQNPVKATTNIGHEKMKIKKTLASDNRNHNKVKDKKVEVFKENAPKHSIKPKVKQVVNKEVLKDKAVKEKEMIGGGGGDIRRMVEKVSKIPQKKLESYQKFRNPLSTRLTPSKMRHNPLAPKHTLPRTPPQIRKNVAEAKNFVPTRNSPRLLKNPVQKFRNIFTNTKPKT